jgi:hypothetical protein
MTCIGIDMETATLFIQIGIESRAPEWGIVYLK